MFVDASALCAIMLDELDRALFERQLVEAADPVTSPIAIWETVRAMTREIDIDVLEARRRLAAYLDIVEVGVAAIGKAEGDAAVEAFDRFGKGRHPARLNMGDCFAYACAKALGRPLLFKGDDFSQTDIERA
ncbi:MAG: type II toxin-antitoxin system VapC family toxin [Caulobacter sp.]|nr:type II toxin-antitoxin system VapC family toxin [Caulobacter sp.]